MTPIVTSVLRVIKQVQRMSDLINKRNNDHATHKQEKIVNNTWGKNQRE
jgi:hypothetical protein